MYAALRRLRQRLLHRGQHKTQFSSGVGPSRPSLLTRLRRAAKTAGFGRETADTGSAADSQEPLNGLSPLSATFDPAVQSSGVIVRPGRSRLSSSPTPYSPLPVNDEEDDAAETWGWAEQGTAASGGTAEVAKASQGVTSFASKTPPKNGFRIGSSGARNRRLYQQQSHKSESSTHLPPFRLRMRMDKYISRALTLLARVSSKAPQEPGTGAEPCLELSRAAGLAFTFSRKVGVGIVGGQRARGFVIQRLDRQAVGGDRDAGLHLSAPLFFKSRSCDAGLQAGAAKCQTLTIFESRRAVENFIQTHTEFETSPGSIAVPLLKGPKSRSVTVSLPGRFRQSRPTVSHQYTVASGAYCNFLPVSGSAVKLDRQMMEGVYGRSVSAIEVLRGWEPTPAQFKALYSALQTWPGPGRNSLVRPLGRRSTAPVPAGLEGAQMISDAGTYSSVRRGAVSDRFQGFRAGSSQPSNISDWQVGEQEAEEQATAVYGPSDRSASQSPPPQRVFTTYTSLPASR